ncbi:hypothetical protein MTO96_014467 [Rhipicephalus appendiculatus]
MFRGRVALVTGGGSGIGRAVCCLLAQRGARVLVADLDLEGSQRHGGIASSDRRSDCFSVSFWSHQGPLNTGLCTLDVGCPDSVKKAFENFEGNRGEHASIVVNCAAILTPPKPFTEVGIDEFDRILRVNLRGTFLVTQAAVHCMLRQKVTGGSIVTFSSVAARVARPGLAAYCASKAAIACFVRSAAADAASSGIRINAVAPCMTDTPMVKAFSEAQVSKFAAGIPMGRAAMPDEVAAVVAFLCGPDSAFVTGTTVDVSGGV